MRGRSASAAVAAVALAAIAGALACSGRGGDPGRTRTFDLTGVGASGVWTLEPVNGLNYWWRRFPPATLFVETGDEVVLHLRSADVFHRLYAPDFSVGPVEVEPGHTVTVRFTASRSGVFQYYCTSMCGACHFFMRGWIVVTDPGAAPVIPPPLLCGTCLPAQAEAPDGATLVDRGALLYAQKGCITCHGPGGRGGLPNLNSTNGTAPRHDTTASKLFLRTPEDAESFLALLEASGDLEAVEEPDVQAFPAVRARFRNAKEIVRKGRFTAKADPRGPQPPLQMPAWQYLLAERQIDALLAYFVSLQDWEAEEEPP